MISLIESLLNEELALLYERRVNARATRTNRQRRHTSYNRAFNNTGVDEKGLQQLLKFVNETYSKQRKKPYSWSLTRWVWISKRICEFAKSFRGKSSTLVSLKNSLVPSFGDFVDYVARTDDVNGNGLTPDKFKDSETRFGYIERYLTKAVEYSKKNKNGWYDVLKSMLQSAPSEPI